jgi:NADP-dependent 3-hydroxy acid dehydrogenase YdfG
VLVNNAGVMLNGTVDGMSLDDLERMLQINVHVPIAMTKAAIAPMRAQGGGHIVNIGSIAARNCGPAAATYSASKAAIAAFSESVRKELAPDRIRVTVVHPGIVDTELFDHIPDRSVRDAYAKVRASFEPLHARDVAEAVVFAVTRPDRVGMHEITLRPHGQPG